MKKHNINNKPKRTTLISALVTLTIALFLYVGYIFSKKDMSSYKINQPKSHAHNYNLRITSISYSIFRDTFGVCLLPS